jgi:hypothetical protein
VSFFIPMPAAGGKKTDGNSPFWELKNCADRNERGPASCDEPAQSAKLRAEKSIFLFLENAGKFNQLCLDGDLGMGEQ